MQLSLCTHLLQSYFWFDFPCSCVLLGCRLSSHGPTNVKTSMARFCAWIWSLNSVPVLNSASLSFKLNSFLCCFAFLWFPSSCLAFDTTSFGFSLFSAYSNQLFLNLLIWQRRLFCDLRIACRWVRGHSFVLYTYAILCHNSVLDSLSHWIQFLLSLVELICLMRLYYKHTHIYRTRRPRPLR